MWLFGKRDEAEKCFKEAKRCSDPSKKEFDLDRAISLLEEAVMLKTDKKQYGQKLEEVREIKAKSQLKFSMQVREVHGGLTSEAGATGVLIDGRVEQGIVRNGDEVEIKGRGATRMAKVEVDDPKGFAVPGEEVLLYVEGLTGGDIDIEKGDVVEKV